MWAWPRMNPYFGVVVIVTGGFGFQALCTSILHRRCVRSLTYRIRVIRGPRLDAHRWSEKTLLPTVFCYALFYGGFGQFVAGVLEVRGRGAWGATSSA